jgi:hypothetical protein
VFGDGRDSNGRRWGEEVAAGDCARGSPTYFLSLFFSPHSLSRTVQQQLPALDDWRRKRRSGAAAVPFAGVRIPREGERATVERCRDGALSP